MENFLLNYYIHLSYFMGYLQVNLMGETNQEYTFTNLSAGDYYYRYLLADREEKLSNPKCRTISNVKVVRVIPKFIDVIDSVCVGLSSTVGENTYFEAGVYVDTLQNIIGCDSIVTLDLTLIENELQATFLVEDPTCNGFTDGSIKIESLTGKGPYTVRVREQFEDGAVDISMLGNGLYEFSISDRYGCEFNTSISITDPPVFEVDLGPDQNLVLGERFTLSEFISEEASDYRWNPITINCQVPCDTLNEIFTSTTTVSLTATSSNGCEATDEILVTIEEVLSLFIPNVLTPNNDSINDYFTIFPEEEINAIDQVQELSIFNRAGVEVFSKKSFEAGVPSQGWNGTSRGSIVSTGVYFYSTRVRFINGEEQTYSGLVSLLR
ncbi:MAG: gliding motility-associated C-terminal domain-containing protein [Bacteroidota bacterium]